MRKKILLGMVILILACLASPAIASDYVGSDQCFKCHTEQYNDWQATGHPWKLREADKARYSKLPLPEGYTWDDISYVIGGANKKARYIDLDGYIITSAKDGSEAKTQYNMENASWAFYNKGKKKPYKCGPCHMTNYSPEGNQDGREGMIGTWSEDGIGCEECHGPGEEHIRNPSQANIVVDTSTESCGKCHQRGGMGPNPPVKGQFIKHHEQINELKAGAHKNLSCVTCHDPHKRAIQAKDNCADCHSGIAKSYAKTLHGQQGTGCIDCHMPKASKSAISVASYTGDVRTHIFKIDTNADAEMFKTIEEKGKKSTFAKGALTVEYTCLSCHGSRDKAWAAQYAKNFHK